MYAFNCISYCNRLKQFKSVLPTTTPNVPTTFPNAPKTKCAPNHTPTQSTITIQLPLIKKVYLIN